MSGEDDGYNSSGSSSDRPWIDHFEELCDSDELSLDELQRMTKGITLDNLHNSSFLHKVCMNKRVTVEMVEHLLHLYPSAAHRCLDIPNYRRFNTYVESAYPLHLACFNEDCPNEVIQILLQRECHNQLTQICHMDFNWGKTGLDCEHYGGTPLHYYLSRTSNVDLGVVKELMSASPAGLLLTDEDSKCTPIHILMNNEVIGDMFDVVKCLSEVCPTSLHTKDRYGQTPLHVACGKRHMTTRTIELLLHLGVAVVYEPNDFSWLAIHSLCGEGNYKGIDDKVAIDILQLLLEAHPDSVSETDNAGELPLHIAASNKSPAFCKALVDAYPESVISESYDSSLPFHCACYSGRPDTAEYLLKLYPESLNTRNNLGYLPIHCVANSPSDNTAEIIKFLLLHDPECLSKPVVSDDEGSHYMQGNGALPQHVACDNIDQFGDMTRRLFDLYPEAILIKNGLGKLPVDVIRKRLDDIELYPRSYLDEYREEIQDLLSYLYTQMGYATKAQNETAMRTADRAGSLPLHNALYGKASLGSIKLLVKGNPDAVDVPDRSGMYPLDIACQFSTVGVIKYLAGLVPERLNSCGFSKNYPLHHACRGVNCEVVSYLLETPVSSASVSERNSDGMLPIQLFCEIVNRSEGEETPEYTETIWRLLSAYPEAVMNW